MPNNNNKNIGVITEQGFVAGQGLGFNPVRENELNPDNKAKDNDKKGKKLEESKK